MPAVRSIRSLSCWLSMPLYRGRIVPEKPAETQNHCWPAGTDSICPAYPWLSSLCRGCRDLSPGHSENTRSEIVSFEYGIFRSARRSHAVSQSCRCVGEAQSLVSAVGSFLVADRFDLSSTDSSVAACGGFISE